MAHRLILDSISYSYPLPGKEEEPALSEVSMTVEPGEVLCMAGRNGSGKSTLAQVCAGILVPASGSITYGDRRISGRGDLLELRKLVGLLFQSPEDQLFADTVWKDIAFGPKNLGLRRDAIDERVRDASALVDLEIEELKDRSPFSLSTGERRRVAMAGILALEPEVLLLDEPFIGLDYDGKEHLRSSLQRFRELRETSIVIITHDLSDAWTLADRFALLSAGRLFGLSDKSEIISSDSDLQDLGLRLPQWGELARELELAGAAIEDPSDPVSLARSIASCKEVRGDR